jgi:hypothetical protein
MSTKKAIFYGGILKKNEEVFVGKYPGVRP